MAIDVALGLHHMYLSNSTFSINDRIFCFWIYLDEPSENNDEVLQSFDFLGQEEGNTEQG